MAFKKTNWKDTIKDALGNILERGTPLNATNLNKLEDGIVKIETEISAQLAETATYNNLMTPTRGIRFIAHRGFSLAAPENTLPAYELAGQMGFWGVETDVQVTSDGEWILMHDTTVDRTTNGAGNVSSLTLAQIKALEIDVGPNVTRYKNLRVPTFKEFLVVCRRYSIVPVIEIKAANVASDYDVFVNILKNEGFEDKCIVISFSTTAMNEVRNRSKKITLQPLLDITQENLDYVKKLGNAGIDTPIAKVTKTLIDLAHKNGVMVNTWGVNSQTQITTAIEAGIDYISTDGQLRGVNG